MTVRSGRAAVRAGHAAVRAGRADAAADDLTGGANADRFVFGPDGNRDRIFDFQNGIDLLDLRAFHFGSKAAALKHLYEVGGASNQVVGFDAHGTIIIIHGADLADIGRADILI